MRISTNYIQQQSVDAMLNQQSALAKTQNQVSTGLRFQSASEDPVAAVKVLDLERQINLTQQYIDNGSVAENKLSVTDGVLSSATDILQRIRELGIQALNDINDGDARTAISEEIIQLNEALVGLANTNDESGQSIFSGYQTDVDAFDATSPFAYNGDSGQRNIRIGDGFLVEVNETGNDVFITDTVAGPAQAIFQTIADFATALTSNTVGVAPNDGDFLTNMTSALDSTYSAQTRVGARLNAIDTQKTINEDIKFRDEATVAEFRDLDYAEAITRLNLQSTGLQAAQQAYVKVQGLSLFNYL
jgi:flagellar hook-associated protein 3 FlgL